MQGEAILIGRRQHQGKPFLLGQFATKETLREGANKRRYDSAKFW